MILARLNIFCNFPENRKGAGDFLIETEASPFAELWGQREADEEEGPGLVCRRSRGFSGKLLDRRAAG
jgi:hypothetical protein